MCIWGQILACILLTELVPRIWRLGLSDFSSLRTISRKLSTNRLMLWQWQAISSWSRASMAMHTYLNRKSTRPHIDLDKLCQPNCGCWYRFRLDNENAHSQKFINNESETSLYSCSKPKRWGSGERMNKIQKWNNRICQGRWHVEKKMFFLIHTDWKPFTRICVEPHPSTISQTGRLRYGRVSPELTGRRMSAFPCWPWQAHPSERSERKNGEDVTDKRNVWALGVLFCFLIVWQASIPYFPFTFNLNGAKTREGKLCSPEEDKTIVAFL